MILYINTTLDDLIEIGLKDDQGKFIAKKKFGSRRTQAEKLLPSIVKLLRDKKLKLSDLRGIAVANRGGSFTSLRIGVVTANALAYALAIPIRGDKGRVKKVKSGKLNFNLIKPVYGGEPRITVKEGNKSKNCGKDVKN